MLKFKTWVLPLVTAILSIVLLKLPYRWMFPDFSEFHQDLMINATKGLLIIGLALILIGYYRLWSNACFPLNRVKRITPLYPALFLVLVYITLSIKSYRTFPADIPLILSVIGITILRTSAEELICRGVMQSWIMGQGMSPRQSILLSSLIFALMHVSNILVHGDWVSVINQVVFAFFMGVLFGSVVLMTGNILFSCFLHTLTNLPAAFKKYNPVPGLTDLDESTVMSFGESVLQVLFFIIIFSPLIVVALFYINHRRWMPERPPSAPIQA